MWDRLDRGKGNYKFPHDFSFEKTWVMVDKRHIRLAYNLYFFSHRTVFFSHHKSANSTFSHDLLAKRKGQS